MTAASNKTGERLGSSAANSRYLKHPAAGWLEDGGPIDAGTAHILSNNVNHLVHESCRHVAWDWRAGSLGNKSTGYSGLYDAAAPTGAAIQNWNKISWSLDPGSSNTGSCARRYPIPLIADAVPEYSTSSPTFRWIRCKIRAKSGSSNSLQIACCITPFNTTPRRASIWAPESNDANFWKTVSTSEETITIDLKPHVFVDAGFQAETLRCEVEGPLPITNRVHMGWLWFGWYATHADDYWRSFSAYEYRESA